MSIHTPDEQTTRELADSMAAIPPRPHHSALLETVNRLCPSACTFRYAFSRGGWYRTGGLIAADGTRVAESLETWARIELKKCGGDMHELLDRHIDAGLQVTRNTGKSHYFVAAYGPSPTEFLQLEVEELQEVMDRELIDPESPPTDLQELLEPLSPVLLDAQPVGAPRYQFRRLFDVRQAVARTSVSAGGKSDITRAMAEWTHSSAAARGHFSEHWVMALREHQDRYRNPVTTLSMVSQHARELKPFQWNIELSGVDMLKQLQAFDRAAKYPSAWYFHLVAGTFTPPKVAYAIAKDMEAGFSYLPETEAVLIRNWVAAPYAA